MSILSRKALLATAAFTAGVMAFTASAAMAENRDMQVATQPYQEYTVTEQVVYVPENRYRTYTTAYPQTATTTYFDVQNIYNPQKIRFLSGGVGEAEQQYISQAEGTFPVKLTFANAKGAYVSDVSVQVSDAKGDKLFQMITDGPVLLLDLKPGTYKISADNGFMKRDENITVGEKRQVNKTLVFNSDARSAYYQ